MSTGPVFTPKPAVSLKGSTVKPTPVKPEKKGFPRVSQTATNPAKVHMSQGVPRKSLVKKIVDAVAAVAVSLQGSKAKKT